MGLDAHAPVPAATSNSGAPVAAPRAQAARGPPELGVAHNLVTMDPETGANAVAHLDHNLGTKNRQWTMVSEPGLASACVEDHTSSACQRGRLNSLCTIATPGLPTPLPRARCAESIDCGVLVRRGHAGWLLQQEGA
eukprot:scaffold330500_cov59-Tisochrysis_lutea.AAC.5